MIARPYYVVDFFLHHIFLRVIETRLVTALIISAIPKEHGVETVRGEMIESVIRVKVAALRFRLYTSKGPSHARLPVGTPDLLVTAGTRGRIHVAAIGAGDEELVIRRRRNRSTIKEVDRKYSDEDEGYCGNPGSRSYAVQPHDSDDHSRVVATRRTFV